MEIKWINQSGSNQAECNSLTKKKLMHKQTGRINSIAGLLIQTETEMNQTNFNLINQQSQFDLISIVDSVSVDSVSV